VQFKAHGEKLGDVLRQELDHHLLPPPLLIQPGLGALDCVLAEAKKSNKIQPKNATIRASNRTHSFLNENAQSITKL
jgi:hypothetical protein